MFIGWRPHGNAVTTVYGLAIERPQGSFAKMLRLLPFGSVSAGLAVAAEQVYVNRMSNAANQTRVPAGWHESLTRSKAEIAQCRSVSLLLILDRLRASAEGLEVAQPADATKAKTGH